MCKRGSWIDDLASLGIVKALWKQLLSLETTTTTRDFFISIEIMISHAHQNRDHIPRDREISQNLVERKYKTSVSIENY